MVTNSKPLSNSRRAADRAGSQTSSENTKSKGLTTLIARSISNIVTSPDTRELSEGPTMTTSSEKTGDVMAENISKIVV